MVRLFERVSPDSFEQRSDQYSHVAVRLARVLLTNQIALEGDLRWTS